MTRLTSEELIELLDIVVGLPAARARILVEIDALRAELTKAEDELERAAIYEHKMDGAYEALRAEIERQAIPQIRALEAKIVFWREQSELREKALKEREAEIATFRNASPSLCNCSECLDIREEFAE